MFPHDFFCVCWESSICMRFCFIRQQLFCLNAIMKSFEIDDLIKMILDSFRFQNMFAYIC